MNLKASSIAKNLGINCKNVFSQRRLVQIECARWQSTQNFPTQCQVVICGAGVVGNSIAYHLTQGGWKDVVVLDQNIVGSGTSSYGSGVLGVFRHSSERWIVRHSIQLIEKLQKEGHDLGLVKCGSINLALSRDRAIALKRRLASIRLSSVQCQWMDRHEISRNHPEINTSDVEGGVWVEDDSVADITAVCRTLSELAQKQGATYVENCEVLGIESEVDLNVHMIPRVSNVKTNRGTIQCEYFVNASGMWSRQLGEKSNPMVRIPSFPANHYYLHTVPMEEAKSGMPIVRDYDGHCFTLCRQGEFIIGGFEPNAKPAFNREIPIDWRANLSSLEGHFEAIHANAEHRLPLLKKAKFQPLINAPDNFSPDAKWILGETAEIDNYFVAVGMNGNSLQGGAGAGLAIAEWIIHGMPPPGMLEFDVRRFIDVHNNRRYLKERTREVVSRHYAIEYPYQSEFEHGRKLRCSPIYVELEAQGAVFGSRMCYERPLYFETHHKRGDPPAQMCGRTFGKPSFMENVRQEYQACRERVGICDLSSFTKLEIKSAGPNKDSAFDVEENQSSGNQVVDYLQKLCSNDVNVPVGGVQHTGMHNERGGYENDCLLIRTSENSYLMLAPTSQQTRIMDWMKRHITYESGVSVSDITSMYTVLTVAGPKSRDLLSMLTNSDLTLHGNLAKVINIAYASGVLIMYFTHMGEPGYTLIIPSEYTIHLYNQIMKVGQDYGIRNFGMVTMRSLRVEKFIPFWAEELDSTVNPYEVGRGYRVKLDKPYFHGKFALIQAKNEGVKRRLVHFTLSDKFDVDSDDWPWGGEPIFRDGVCVGNVTSTAYGFTLGKMVCLGWVSNPEPPNFVTPDFVNTAELYQVDIGGRLVEAVPSLQTPKMPIVRMDGMESYRPKVRGIVKRK